ncbi:hypothetical protein ISF_09336 [Cordyceps fumosorosea ARSEF 2679]|uniref:Uncharacterized protein n=1 Tax=Cordyceps fumosorosea (strain ARSEF 2679) TaxID=1081104 RepID=A0A162JY58_CORFA|nr:hypothetical protein ISF_09336 [Cordyceps fumosorosea ARSEF 2679]OAA50718.1 hypothetical protein ISF_09336 [Cordyceps fumosorosea ARSEF 2679]
MQTKPILVSLLASGLATAGVNPYSTPAECTVPAVAYTSPALHFSDTSPVYTSPVYTSPVYTSPVYTSPAYTKPTMSTMSSISFEQYGSPSAPLVASTSHSYPKPAEYTPSSSHVTVKVVSETTGCTTSSYPQKSGMHTTTSYKPSTTGTSTYKTSTTGTFKTTSSVTPTHSIVQNVSSRMNARGVVAATVVAVLFLLM